MHQEPATSPSAAPPAPAAGGSTLSGCPGHQLLARLSERWATLLVEALADGPRHHGELMRALPGITQKMLTQTLRGLERDGLVRRVLHPTRPVRVSYSLTSLGHELFLLQRRIHTWAIDHMGEIRHAQAVFDAEVLDGRRVSVLDLNRGRPPVDENPSHQHHLRPE